MTEDSELKQLPPIHRIREPKMQYASTRIRWYLALGYTRAEIAKGLGMAYRHVNNVMVTIPKRAAREDLPPHTLADLELWPLADDLEAMEQHALEQQMVAQKAETSANRKAINKMRRELAELGLDDDEIVD